MEINKEQRLKAARKFNKKLLPSERKALAEIDKKYDGFRLKEKEKPLKKAPKVLVNRETAAGRKRSLMDKSIKGTTMRAGKYAKGS